MAKTRVRLGTARFWWGAKSQDIVDLLLPDLAPYYEFELDGDPDVVLYGPYLGPMPQGNYLKVFIGCENVRPIMSECDWAFGVGHEETEASDRYMRFARWGDNSVLLQKPKDWPAILAGKSDFCVFLYSNRVPYREAFFKALSRYKRVDAPGRSMNNMPGIDAEPGKIDWAATVEFLRKYKFVIAFENSSFPGYNTEKLVHALQADAIPIYWGDPCIGRSFNERRIIDAHRFLPPPRRYLPRLPWRPHSIKGNGHSGLVGRIANRWNRECERLEQRIWALHGFEALVAHIIQVDKDDSLYLNYIREPNLRDNRRSDYGSWTERWRLIFESALARRRMK